PARSNIRVSERTRSGLIGPLLFWGSLTLGLTEHLVELAAGIAVGEFGERPLLRHLLRCLHEAGPRHPRQRTTDADAAHAEIPCDLQRRASRADQEIDGLWRDR